MPFDLQKIVSSVEFWLSLVGVTGSIFTGITSVPKWVRLWKTRKIRKIWGLKDGDVVIVICSELENPDIRQNVEAREFIYNLKYGDVDAYFEVIVTLLRLYPNLKLKVLSAGEAEIIQVDMSQNLILIGGPDYNSFVGQFIGDDVTQFTYRSPYVETKSESYPNEIVLYNKTEQKEYCELKEIKDYGYFERINNPNNKKNKVILIGGCHTIGVTGAVKAFSLAKSEYGLIQETVLDNSNLVARKIKKKSEFAILVKVKKISQSINTPIVQEENIFIVSQAKKLSVRHKIHAE